MLTIRGEELPIVYTDALAQFNELGGEGLEWCNELSELKGKIERIKEMVEIKKRNVDKKLDGLWGRLRVLDKQYNDLVL